MKISKKAAVSMLIAMGYSTVNKWDLERLTERVNNLSEMVDEDTEVGGTAADRKLYEQVLKANKSETKITLVDDADGDEAPAKPAKATKPTKAPKQEEVEIEEDEDEEEEEADEEEAEEEEEEAPAKPAKKAAKAPPAKPAKKAAKAPPAKAAKGKTPPAKGKAPAPKAKDDDGEKKPKVIASIIEMLQAASKTKPITKAQILEKLAKIFPDKVVEPGHGMHITVTVQVPKRLREDRGLDVRGDTKTGFWLPK